MKKVYFILFLIISSKGFSQFIINDKSGNEFDGYETRVYSEPIFTDGTRACASKTIFEIQKMGIYFWTSCMFNDRSPYTIAKMILTIDGKNKEIELPLGYASQSTYNIPPDNYPYRGTPYCISYQFTKQYDSRVSDEFILDLAKATQISVKILNYEFSPYEDVYFKMNLNPSNTIKALNAFGFYDRALGHLMEKEKIKKEEEERLAKEKEAAELRKKQIAELTNEIDLLIENNVLDAAKKWHDR